MVEYRLAKPQERDDYYRFANMVFNQNGDPIDFELGIPKVYAPDRETAKYQHIAVDDARGIIGLVAALPNTIETPAGALKCGYIGTVSVHPNARGEGHMKALMRFTMDDLRAQGMDLVVLNGRRQRYGFFGFAQGGQMYRYDISIGNMVYALKDVNVSDAKFVKIEEGSELEAKALELHNARAVHYDRFELGFVRCCKTFFNQPRAFFWNGEFVGFMVNTQDKNTLNEVCAVSTEALDAMLKAWYQQMGRSNITVAVAPWDVATRRHLEKYAEHMNIMPNVHVHVLNFASVIEKLLTIKAGYSKIADGTLELAIDGEKLTVTVCDGKVSVTKGAENPICLNEYEASLMLFHPFEYEGQPETPLNWFPLPLCASVPDEF